MDRSVYLHMGTSGTTQNGEKQLLVTVPTLYKLPKVHKNSENPPGGPSEIIPSQNPSLNL